MTINNYDYLVSEDKFDYEFFSEGPKGRIRKVIFFRPISQENFSFNLAFGDLDDKGVFNDLITSNNHDAEKILATVGKAVISFTNFYPEAIIYAEGSTPSRTRRYQMGINKFWKEIELDFFVYGLIGKDFESFRSGKNYMGFAVKRKISNFIL